MNLAASYSLEDGNSTEGKANPYMRLITMEPTVPADANYRGHPEGLIAADPNPILQGERIKDDTRTMRTMGNAYAGFEIIKGLKLNGQVGLDMRSVEWTYFKPMDLNKKERREGKQSNTNGYKTLYQGTLDYNRSFGDHTIGAMAGISQEFYHQKRVFLDSWDFATDDIHTFNTAATFRNWDDSETEWALVSYFGRLQYNFNDRYLFSASIRRDGSSRFGEDNKWGVFPAFSGAWRISEENFMSSVDWLSNLKIRASWGQTGNDNIGNYSSYGRLNPSNYAYGGSLIFGFAPSSPDNPSLSWETTTTTNLGLDFGILANRVSLSVDIYQNDTEDLLFDVPAPAISGFKGSLTLNSGAIQNKGIEVELTSTNIRKGPFTWKTMFNFSRNVNEVKSLGYGIQSIIGQLRSQPTHITTAGLPIMSYYLYDYDGLYTQEDIENPNVAKYNNAEAGNEKIIDQNDDGIIDDDDRTVVGDNLPDAIMGMTNTFKFGNFDLSILLTASLGYDSYFMFGRYIDAPGGSSRSNMKQTLNHYRSAEEPGDGRTPYPFGANVEFSDRWMYSGDYFRIKNLTFGYSLPKSVISKIKMSTLRVYVSMDNLLTVTDFPGGNPESESFSGGDYVRGVDYGTYPLYKTFIIGVKVGF
jgi:TonB-linked SusC/RagA family outer membrane protein